MSWSLFLLVISACLIQDIQTAPKGCLDCRLTPCEQCRVLAMSVLWGDEEVQIVELTCRLDQQNYQQFCSEIRGKEAEFVNTVLEYKKSGEDKNVMVSFSSRNAHCHTVGVVLPYFAVSWIVVICGGDKIHSICQDGDPYTKMSWSLFLLVISACLIQDVKTAPKAMKLSRCYLPNQSIYSTNCELTLCEQCQMLALMVIWTENYPRDVIPDYDSEDFGVNFVKACHADWSYQQFCSQIQGKEAEFVDTVREYKKNWNEREVCSKSTFSVCDPPRMVNDSSWKLKTLNTCEQCQSTLSRLTNLPDEIPLWRQYFYTMLSFFLKDNCRLSDDHLFSEFCALIEIKELEIVETALDCSEVKFKDDKFQPNCTVSGSDDHRDRMLKVCERYVESCKVVQLPPV
ncbi:hypothetical protein Ddc_17017 [Ditylenchus destructor]|nr:hypothetical protein Ddc_17017 [Ditylenchus destructor]